MLQNSQQTYKNTETWIADGSDKPEVSKKIDEFCALHKNIHLFRYKRPSLNKGDNINSFLRYYKEELHQTYDYLMMCDADVAIHRCFVETTLKIYSSPKGRNLGIISPQILQYAVDNLFGVVCTLTLNRGHYRGTDTMSFVPNFFRDVAGACCLIKKEMLDDINGGYIPDVTIEDFYITAYAAKKDWYTLQSPVCTCFEMTDVTYKAYWTRMIRISDHMVKCMIKCSPFKNYNDHYSNFYLYWITSALGGALAIASALFLSVFLSLILIYRNVLFSNLLQILTFCIPIGVTFIVSLILSFVQNHIFYKKKLSILITIFYPCFILTRLSMSVFSNFKTLVLKKYSDFTSNSSASTRLTATKLKGFHIKNWLIVCLVSFAILFVFNFLFFWFNLLGVSQFFMFLVVILDTFLGWAFISTLFSCIYQSFSHIKVNNGYSHDKFIYPENDEFNFCKVKDKFYKDHPECEVIY